MSAQTQAASMHVPARSLLTQPTVGIITAVAGIIAMLESWVLAPPRLSSSLGETAMLALWLMAGLSLSYQFPVHIRYTTKIQMGSVPLYLMAVLLPPPVAAAAVGLGTVVGEWGVRKQRGTYPSDMASQAGRWTVVVLLGSLVAHLQTGGLVAHGLLLTFTALLLLAGDILTTPLIVAPLTGERPRHIVVETGRGIGLPEAGQYFMGLMGAILAAQDIWAITLLLLPTALVYRVSKRAKEMHESTRLLLENLADRVDQRDPYTHHHSIRVTTMTQEILRELQVVGPEARLIVTAARVHDIGKIAIPEDLLHKHEQLTPEEWAIIHTHPGVGSDMLTTYPAFARGAGIVRGHHERWDGQGYPDKIKGTDIAFGARVIAVADSFDAMTSDRPYRTAMTTERAVAILQAGAGTQWDPEIVQAFLRTIADRLEHPVSEITAVTRAPSAAGQVGRV
jgi:hypothetical protein